MAVIKDVAQRAGVSIGTVSKFFNHPELLRSETRDRVEKAVAELNYRPNPLARSMRTGRTHTVAVLVPEIANPFYAEGFSCLSAEMIAAGFMPLLITTDNNPIMTDEKRLSLLFAQTDAIVLYLLDNELNARLLPLLFKKKPAIVVSQRPEPLAQHSIIIEEAKGMRMVARHLEAIDRRRIAFIGGPDKDPMTDTKLEGFSRGLAEGGAHLSKIVRCAGFSPRLGYLAAKQLWGSGLRPDAFCCANDALAMGCLKYLNANRIAVPQRVAVTGYDDLALSRITEPALTTVRLPIQETAKVTASVLLSIDSAESSVKRLETSLVIRGSTVEGAGEDIYR